MVSQTFHGKCSGDTTLNSLIFPELVLTVALVEVAPDNSNMMT